MRGVLLGAIRAYWRLVPPQRRRTCLFAKSCSRHVYDLTSQEGAAAGLRGLRDRFSACRSGYALLALRDEDGGALVRLADGRVVRLDDMSQTVRDGLETI